MPTVFPTLVLKPTLSNRLQGAFSTLVGLFDRVGLRKNVGKTVVMFYLPCQVAGNQSEAAYGRQITG